MSVSGWSWQEYLRTPHHIVRQTFMIAEVREGMAEYERELVRK